MIHFIKNHFKHYVNALWIRKWCPLIYVHNGVQMSETTSAFFPLHHYFNMSILNWVKGLIEACILEGIRMHLVCPPLNSIHVYMWFITCKNNMTLCFNNSGTQGYPRLHGLYHPVWAVNVPKNRFYWIIWSFLWIYLTGELN